jgi:hypothetical protein
VFAEFIVSDLRDAFTSARGAPAAREQEGGGSRPSRSPFETGAAWVRDVLVPAIERANAELQPERIAFATDLNLDPRSTPHAHADFWLTTLSDGARAAGARHSLNVIDGEIVMLYRPGAPGQALGTLDECGPDAIRDLLRRALQQFGEQLRGSPRD